MNGDIVTAQPHSKDTVATMNRRKEMKVLVVDNHPLILRFMQKLLSREGYDVKTAQDGISALDILQTWTPRVAFVDLIMPNIDGNKLCQIIRKMPRLQDMYIVILSAIVAEEKINFAECGADSCIAKGPFDVMSQNILRLLDKLACGSPERLPQEILGLESVYPRQITKELLSVKRHFELVLGSMSEGIVELDAQGRIVFANTAAVSLIGVEEEHLLGMMFDNLFDVPERQRANEFIRKISGQPFREEEERPIDLKGRKVVLSGFPIGLGEQKGIIILTDVTERKRLEEQLVIAQKAEALGTLAGGIAHDFNNLLMGVQGNASLMLMDLDETHPYYEKLCTIEKLVRNGSKLTTQLLAYARKGRYEVRPLNLNELILETAQTFGRTRRQVSIRCELADDLMAIEADQGQIEQVLFNLYVNSADAMPGGGTLLLKTMNLGHKKIKGKGYEPKAGMYVVLTVGDTGTGMDEKTVKRIFDPFFTTKEMGRGTGLGLASVYGIIKGHGGYIDVDSSIGSGSVFTIYLPATRKNVQKAVRSPLQIVKGTEAILLVDDEELILNVGEEMLGALGYRVFRARNGKEAIKLYRRHQASIDMIILDMVMPNLGGGATFDVFKEINPYVKVLLSSGYSIEGEASKILGRGCSGFIQKPFRIEDLSVKIREILDREEKNV
ncbi:MAG: response regulator [Deltaproteobacteria bacterium]|nr:response regulator [Deltaproteobacteria bacterium]